MQKLRRPIIAGVLLVVVIAVIWFWVQNNMASTDGRIQASGTVEAVEVFVGPEMAGRVVEVLVSKGDLVQEGTPLLRLDDTLLQSQRNLALAALDVVKGKLTSAQINLEIAQSNLEMAELAVQSAQVQYESALSAARYAELPGRMRAWQQDVPNEFDQPVWYFTRLEELDAARQQVDLARDAYLAEQANFERVVQGASNENLAEVEHQLAETRAAFLVTEEVLARAKAQNDQELQDFAQSLYDAAKAELEAVQTEYDRLLSETASKDVLEARARLAVAKERYDAARDRLDQLLTGEHSLQVQAAELVLLQAKAGASQAQLAVRQAQAGLDQAEKAVAQSQAELDLIDVQIEKLVVYAATPGVIVSRNVEPGEILQAGAPVLTIGQLDSLTITVYVPEDRYGQVHLGNRAQVTVDSFPGRVFTATVTHIADRAEFTPRNVQTAEGRRTTVFAIELSIENPQGELKHGMPADVVFVISE